MEDTQNTIQPEAHYTLKYYSTALQRQETLQITAGRTHHCILAKSSERVKKGRKKKTKEMLGKAQY